MLFSLWQADSVPNDHFRCYLFVNAVWQILFPNSRKTREGCVWDMNKRVRTAQESSFFLLVKYNSTHSVMGRYQGRKRKAWYLNMRKPVLIKLLNWRNHWKRKSRYADYRYQVTELLDPPTPMPAPLTTFFFLKSTGWQDFQHFEEKPRLIPGRCFRWGLPSWWLKVAYLH